MLVSEAEQPTMVAARGSNGKCRVVLPVNQAANLRVFGVDGFGSNDASNCCGV